MTIEEIISIQKQERYRCFVLCGAGLTGKTKLAKRTLKRIGGKYYDLLSILEENKELSANVNLIDPEQLFRMIDDEKQDLIIADHLDIVFSLWTETKQKEFLRRFDNKSNGTCIMLILHNYKLLDEKNIMRNNSHEMKRIINIAEISY